MLVCVHVCLSINFFFKFNSIKLTNYNINQKHTVFLDKGNQLNPIYIKY